VEHEVQAMWDTVSAHRESSEDAADRATVDALLAQRPRLDAWLRQAPALLAGALLTRVHGDFHLGQILVAFDDVVLIDFEGEPAKSLDARRAKASPLHDVAGFLRSLDYASEVSARGEEGTAARAGVGLDTVLDAFLSAFRSRVSATFLAAYREVLDASPHPWVAPAAFDTTTLLFLIEKASYEIRYEAANRPAWSMVPIQGLLRILERFPAPEEAMQ
jgi:maltose alpha-D-glucosyltransferase/alpha-amylase